MSAATYACEGADPRVQILDAAQDRLIRYGYHKTTMAEIAHDVGMSAANLYRYFGNKEEIAAECATRCMNERFERLRAIVGDDRLGVDQKLLGYAMELVDDSHALAGEDSQIGELVATIMHRRQSLVHEKLDVHYELLGDILRAGVEAGEFSIDNIDTTARNLYSTLSFFDVPLFIGLYDRAEFERRAVGVVGVLLDGLRARPRPDAIS